MRRIDAVELGFERACSMLRRPEGERLASAQKIAAEIIEEVRARGDAALLALSRRFDCDSLQTIEVEQSAWQRAENDVLPGVKSALQKAAERIRDFHLSQAARSWMNAAPERITGQLVRPLRQVGVYVPGGAAAYPSSVLMTVIPARCAGVEQVVMCTPAQSNGTVMPAVLYAAMLAGVDRLFCVGGAQAIAAMALGTETIPPVDKIVGPGNIYVNAAKKMLWGTVDIDMIAGPS
ncbi:MAG TPA: histidinol dehydrogenase, partial [Chthonomonadales bacterium]|nr:histidinol dehydrogenase [Chthonomonadales bacterium]